MSAPARLSAAAGSLTTAAVKVMDEGLPWFGELGAQERAWVTDVAGAGIRAFLEWCDREDPAWNFTADVFDAAPPELARSISLEQTVALVRTTIGVVESAVDELVDAPLRPKLREAILRYSREVAFSAAEVYARAAEVRGAWDARLEAHIVDALVRHDFDETLPGRMAALGWATQQTFITIAGHSPDGDGALALDVLRRSARHHGVDVLTGIHGTVLFAIVGGTSDAHRIGRLLSPHFGEGPVVMSRAVPDFSDVPHAVRATIAALAAAPGWPQAPRPVRVEELWPERALMGDATAVAALLEYVVDPLIDEPALYETACTFLEVTPGIEPTARALFIHPNTVRYRLRKISELTGCSPLDPRGAYVLRTAITFGRLRPKTADSL
jgi:PucR C-terminal helix-turn-helix domain/GGDEF-like domain